MSAVRTEDRVTLKSGDHAFNYYDRKPGVIGDDVDGEGWFTFRHDDGTTASLNGERICSDTFAIGKGWMPAPATALVLPPHVVDYYGLEVR